MSLSRQRWGEGSGWGFGDAGVGPFCEGQDVSGAWWGTRMRVFGLCCLLSCCGA